MNDQPKFVFNPILILDGGKRFLTPFSLIPVPIAHNSTRLMHLASVPFHWLRFLNPETYDRGHSTSIDLWFLHEYGFPPEDLVRYKTVILWSNNPQVVELLYQLLQAKAMMIELIIDDIKIFKMVQEYTQDINHIKVVYVGDPLSKLIALDASRKIWLGFLEMYEAMLKGIGAEEPIWPLGPGAGTIPVEELREMSRYNAYTPLGTLFESAEIPDDYVVIPNKIILNHGMNRLSVWTNEPTNIETQFETVVKDSKQIMALRGMNQHIRSARRFSDPNSGGPYATYKDFVENHCPSLPDPWYNWVLNLAENKLVTPPPQDSMPVDCFAMLCPPQLVFLCPSKSEEVGQQLNDYEFLMDNVVIKDLIDREQDYYNHILEQIGKPGRKKEFRPPANADQEKLLGSMQTTLRRENEVHSALMVFYAMRFTHPVLKLPKTDSKYLDDYKKINARFEESSDHDTFSLNEELAAKIAEELELLSSSNTKNVPPEYLEFIKWVDDLNHVTISPIIHTFSDYPLDFVQYNDDYLGYQAELSRTPLTPGLTAFTNYFATDSTSEFPSDPEDFLLVSPFDLEEFLPVLNTHYIPKFRNRVVKRHGDLIDALEDESVKFLVYIGHGMYDPETRRSSLVLQDPPFFNEQDLAGLSRLPDTVVLIGCNTAAASSIVQGFQTTLLRLGVKNVIGTIFPVPIFIGYQFLALLISNLLSPNYPLSNNRTERYRDLSQVMTVVRRRLRYFSDTYSLLEQKRISKEEYGLSKQFLVQAMSTWSLEQKSNDKNQFRVLIDLLKQLKILAPDANALLNSRIIPYPLFFQLFGYPWNHYH